MVGKRNVNIGESFSSKKLLLQIFHHYFSCFVCFFARLFDGQTAEDENKIVKRSTIM
jgi:hypothetical protein